MHHGAQGNFAIRKGDWVLIDAPGGDDDGARGELQSLKDERGYTHHDQPDELFNVREDITERHNHFAEKPQLLGESKSLLHKYEREAAALSASLGRMTWRSRSSHRAPYQEKPRQ